MKKNPHKSKFYKKTNLNNHLKVGVKNYIYFQSMEHGRVFFFEGKYFVRLFNKYFFNVISRLCTKYPILVQGPQFFKLKIKSNKILLEDLHINIGVVYL